MRKKFWKSFLIILCIVCLFLISTTAAADSIPIEFGQTISVTIENGQTVNYTFPAQSGEKGLTRVSVGISEPVGATCWLYAPNGTLLGDTERPNYEFLASLPDTGTYTLILGSHSSTAPTPCSFYIQRVNNPTGYTTAESGKTITASIDIPAEKDTYRFTAQAGDGIIIRMQGSSIYPSLLEVYGPDGCIFPKKKTRYIFKAPSIRALYPPCMQPWEWSKHADRHLLARLPKFQHFRKFSCPRIWINSKCGIKPNAWNVQGIYVPCTGGGYGNLPGYPLVYQNPLVRHAGCMPQWHPFRRYRETQL